MKIASSMVSISSQQTDITSSSTFSYLRKWDKKAESVETSHAENDTLISHSKERHDRVQISADQLQKSYVHQNNNVKKEKDLLDDYEDELYGDIKLKIFKDLVEMFTGNEIKVYRPQDHLENGDTPEDLTDPSSTTPDSATSSEEPKTAGWGIDYFYRETKYIKEAFTFEAAGKVTTDTGKELSFTTSLSMSRENYEELTVSIKAGDALIDPLVIDFTGTGAKISNIDFNFDLNFDGVTDTIASPSSGSGFLAYDKNGDGIINDGSELFGPSTNDGFAELSAFDDDNNGWIDENDALFSSLSIWEKDSDGIDHISTLLDKNVGAIYTGHANTKFKLLDSANIHNGNIRQSGIWLNEKTDQSGIIQEIDLVA